MKEKVITINELYEGQTVTYSDKNMYDKNTVSAYAGITFKVVKEHKPKNILKRIATLLGI